MEGCFAGSAVCRFLLVMVEMVFYACARPRHGGHSADVMGGMLAAARSARALVVCWRRL